MVEPVLQIVHVSDMHVVVPGHPGPRLLRWVERGLKRRGPAVVYEKIRSGTAPHDTFAPVFLCQFLEQIGWKDPIWSTRPLWIVDTGDQTTYGDAGSIAVAQAELAGFAAAAQGPAGMPVGALTRVYGNHDAWPETMPFLGAPAIASHSARIALTYVCDKATLGLRCPLPSGAEIQLYTLDTVDDGVIANTFARGHVSSRQIKELKALVAANRGVGSPPHLRLLATHHPIHYPPPRSNVSMCLANDSHVGSEVDKSDLAHLVLSGHTHQLFPAHGSLPQSPRACHHPALGMDQAQLVAGSLMQLDRLANRHYAHQCEVLRIYQDPVHPTSAIVERLFAARTPTKVAGVGTGGIGPYLFVPSANGEVGEELQLAL